MIFYDEAEKKYASAELPVELSDALLAGLVRLMGEANVVLK